MVRQRDADLRVGVHDEARSSRSPTGSAPPQTYGTPRNCIATPTTPPYCDEGAAATGASGVDLARSRDRRSGDRARRPGSAPRPFAAARGAGRAWAASSSWRRCFGRLQLRDLRLDRREHALPARQLALDRAALRWRATRRPAAAARAPWSSRSLRASTSALNARTSWTTRASWRADAVDRLEPVQEIVQALRAEQDLEPGRALAAVHVEGTEPLREVDLRVLETAAREHEMTRVRRQLGLDLVELDVREVVALDGLLELRCRSGGSARGRPAPGRASTDLGRVGGGRADGQENSRHEQAECRRVSSQLNLFMLPERPTDAPPRAPAYVTSSAP